LKLHISFRKPSLPAACILVSIALGALIGLLVGQAITLHFVKTRLDQYASRILVQGEASSSDARAVLAKMNASPYPICSHMEEAYFRQLLLFSEFTKDAGRIQDGEIICSTTLSDLSGPFPLPKPNFSQTDGTSVYLNLEPFRIQNRTVITLRLRDSYIVMSPFVLAHLEPSPMHYTITVTDALSHQTGHLRGDNPGIPDDLLSKNGQKRIGATFYSTLCSERYFNCITAFISIPEAYRANESLRLAGVLLGSIFGGTFGLILILAHKRNQGVGQRLFRAIQEDKLLVLYQPIVELHSRRIVGAEALVRWVDKANSDIGPDVFIKIAEERGFIGLVTKHLVQQTLEDFALTMMKEPDFHVNINVTGSDLSDPKFFPMLRDMIRNAGVPAASLGIEITESSTARHGVAKQTIKSLRKLGHKVYIDDFGTGYSNLAYLHDLEVDAIKIDRAFTKAIGTEAVTVEILPQILSIAKALKLQVVVEGIETPLQAEYFAPSDPPLLAQGWLFGKPMTATEFHQLRTRVAELVLL
jgi:sensor c-di-GMP phosphodiesterase-like protein